MTPRLPLPAPVAAVIASHLPLAWTLDPEPAVMAWCYRSPDGWRVYVWPDGTADAVRGGDPRTRVALGGRGRIWPLPAEAERLARAMTLVAAVAVGRAA